MINVREFSIKTDPDYVWVWRLVDMFIATGGGGITYDPHKLLELVKKIKEG